MIVIRSHTSRHMALLLRTGLFCTILLLLAACRTSGPAAETTLPTEVPTATTAPTVAAPTATAEPAEEDPTATPEPEEEAAADSDPDPVDSALAAEPVEITPAEPQGPSGSVVAEAGVNVRTGPGTDYPILALQRDFRINETFLAMRAIGVEVAPLTIVDDVESESGIEGGQG